MVHPNVLANCSIDPEEYSGFAFGFGIDRLAKEGGLPFLQLFAARNTRNNLEHFTDASEPPGKYSPRIHMRYCYALL